VNVAFYREEPSERRVHRSGCCASGTWYAGQAEVSGVVWRGVPARPGRLSEVLTEHYRRAHPKVLGLPSQ